MRKLIIVVWACCGMFVGAASAGPVASPPAEFRLPAELGAVLCGHLHVAAVRRFSETVDEYTAGALFAGDAWEIRFG